MAKTRDNGRLVVVVLLAIIAAAAVAVAIVAVAGAGKVSKSLNALTPKGGRPAGYRGPSYAGMLTQDRVAGGPGTRVSMAGEALTAGNLTRVSSLLGPTLCVPVTAANQSATTKDAGPVEWKLQQPNGIVETAAITGTLQLGQVAPGGTAIGTVCFVDSGQAGTFVLLWQPLFQVGRAVWLLPA